MSTISKANRPRRSPGMTKNGKPRLRSLGIKQLEEMYNKASTPKLKDKVKQELNKQRARSN